MLFKNKILRLFLTSILCVTKRISFQNLQISRGKALSQAKNGLQVHLI